MAAGAQASAGDVEEAALGVAQHQHGQHGDADQAGPGLGADRDQQAGEDQGAANSFTRQSGGKMVPWRASHRMIGMSAIATVEMVLLS
jgi:hypothetical protein